MKTTSKALFALIFAVLTFGVPHAAGQVMDEQTPYLNITLLFNKKIYPRKFGVNYPTYAVWVEEEQSGDVRTIYLTKKLAYNNWMFAKNRPSSAPVWYGAKKKEIKASGPLDVDAISSATPSGERHYIRWPVPMEFQNKKIGIYIEANVSFDYNDSYPKGSKKGDDNYNGYNGQPSLVWKATLKTDSESKTDFMPEIIGHGQVLGNDHNIDSDMSKITTARDLFIEIRCSYTAGSK